MHLWLCATLSASQPSPHKSLIHKHMFIQTHFLTSLNPDVKKYPGHHFLLLTREFQNAPVMQKLPRSPVKVCFYKYILIGALFCHQLEVCTLYHLFTENRIIHSLVLCQKYSPSCFDMSQVLLEKFNENDFTNFKNWKKEEKMTH